MKNISTPTTEQIRWAYVNQSWDKDPDTEFDLWFATERNRIAELAIAKERERIVELLEANHLTAASELIEQDALGEYK